MQVMLTSLFPWFFLSINRFFNTSFMLFALLEDSYCVFCLVTTAFRFGHLNNLFVLCDLQLTSIYLWCTVTHCPAVPNPQGYIQAICWVIFLTMCWHHRQWVSVSWMHSLVCGDTRSFFQQCVRAGFSI